MFAVENAILLGVPILVENVDENINPIFDSIVNSKKNSNHLKWGDKQIDIHPNFRFYMTSRMNQPFISFDAFLKMNVINFRMTAEGLEDLMLNNIVKIEESIKDEQRQKNLKELFETKLKMKVVED